MTLSLRFQNGSLRTFSRMIVVEAAKRGANSWLNVHALDNFRAPCNALYRVDPDSSNQDPSPHEMSILFCAQQKKQVNTVLEMYSRTQLFLPSS